MQFELLLLQSSSPFVFLLSPGAWDRDPESSLCVVCVAAPFIMRHKRPVECATYEFNHDTTTICIKKQRGVYFSAVAKKEAARAPLFGTCRTVD